MVFPKGRRRGTASEPKDLGFGTAVGVGRGGRLLNRDGSFTVRRVGLGFREFLSLYHSLLTMRWAMFLLLCAATYVGGNALFAVLYLMAGENAVSAPPDMQEHGRFLSAFFMSVQTMSGVGYGHMRPVGLMANWIMTAEAYVGLLLTALVTGLVFARFARPQMDLAFSRLAIVAPYRGGRGLMLRVANRRRNPLTNLEAKLMVSRIERREGATKRAFEELALERTSVTFFPMSWTIVHPIVEGSPFFDRTLEQWAAEDLELFVMLTGFDESMSQVVQARTSYKASEMQVGVRFADLFVRDETGNPKAVDISRIHDVEPATL